MRKLIYIFFLLGCTNLKAQESNIDFFKGNHFYIDSLTVIDDSVINTAMLPSYYLSGLSFFNSKASLLCTLPINSEEEDNRLFTLQTFCHPFRQHF